MLAPFGRILLCYDASPEGMRALRCGAMLARRLDAETHLLSVLDLSYWSVGFGVMSSLGFDLDEAAAKKALDDGIERLRFWGVAATGHCAVGSAVDQIATFARSLRADLIVIGHHPHSAFSRWWNGSNHALLLDRVSCGVLFEVLG